jgi:PmbA protein
MRPDDIASAAIRAARAAGADHAEAFVSRSRSLSAYVDDSRVKSMEEKSDLGVAVRVMVGGKVGQSSSFASTPRQAEACARAAVASAAALPKDDVFKGFAWPAKEQHRVKAKATEMDGLTAERLAEVLKQVVGTAVDGSVKVPNGILRAGELESVVANTNDLLTRREASLVHLHITAMTDDASPGEGVEVFSSPYLKDLDGQEVGRSLRAKAKASADAKAYKGNERLPVIFPPEELSEMLQGSVQFALSAENVYRKRSPLASRMGKQVTARCLTVTDDPSDRRGMLSSSFDDEGTPTKRKPLIKEGVLKGFLYDLYNAHLSDTQPTGNGLRRSPADTVGNYQIPVGISPVCLVVKPGQKSVEDLIGETERGLLLEKTASPEVHPITGAFGLEVRCAHLIEKGEMAGTIRHCLLSGNMFAALGQIGAVARDATVSRNLILPSIRFEDLELIGG